MPVRGDKETARALRALSQYVGVPLATTSRFALQPTLKAAKANAKSLPLKEKTGTLAASLVIKQKPRTSKLKPTFQVGPDSGFQRDTQFGSRRPVRYAHLVEFGTAPHYQPGRGVVHPGTAPHPFMTPAYFATREQVVERFGTKIGPEMEKRAAKLAAKKAKT
jgi:HK97 gp10 family phage protein